MKGGVTSGIVYPEAVYRISRAFDLKSIGGTSAGAIAAALAAAAEYCRRSPGGSDAGFERVRALPAALSADNGLLKLFTPNRATAALFGIAVDLFNPKTPAWLKALCLVRAYPFHAAIGLVPAALYADATVSVPSLWLRVVDWIVVAVIALVAATAASAGGLVWDALRKLPRNYFGLATGIADDSGDVHALGTWLTQELETTAGIAPGGVPLTFGMLWNPQNGPRACAYDVAPATADCSINLQMITTSLTEGRPFQFPTSTARYYFKPAELEAFFPPHVVRWMCDRARKGGLQFEGFVALPPIGDLPVVVATRMSLAFPVLLSAVPLYAVEWGTPPSQPPHRVWFSDGGLTSNFPIQMFDSPLPRWPTLALNLGAESAQAVTSVFGFLASVFSAAQNWNDTMQSVLPGFRDRIATVVLAPNEGGLNLDMSPAEVETLRERGGKAADALIERFVAPSELAENAPLRSWEDHRWTRLRVELDVLASHLQRFGDAFATPHQPHDVPYARLIGASDPKTIPLRRFPLEGEDAGRAATEAVASSTATLGQAYAATAAIRDDVPKPEPSLVVRADLSR